MTLPALECDRINEDLDFLSEIKNEVSSLPIKVEVQPQDVLSEVQNEVSSLTTISEGHPQGDASQTLRRNFSVYHGMRRNSSFADYFEGDLSQNLLSRRHFCSLSESSTSSNKEQIINNIVDQIKDGGHNHISTEGKLKKFSELFLNHWFFSNSKQTQDNGNRRRKRTISLPSEDVEVNDAGNLNDDCKESEKNIDKKASTLAMFVSKHFSATTDIRAQNINMPQSQ